MRQLIYLLIISFCANNLRLIPKVNAQSEASSLSVNTESSVSTAGLENKGKVSDPGPILGNGVIAPAPQGNLQMYPSSGESSNLLSPAHPQPLEIAQGAAGTVGDTFSPENTDGLRQELLIEPITRKKTVFPPTPGSTLGVPTAFGANWGNAFIGGAFATGSPPNRDQADGSLSLGMGFWNSRKAVGIEVDLGISNLAGDSVGGNSGADGQIGFKIHRLLDTKKGNWAVAVGWENAIRWGDSTDSLVASNKDTFYGVVTGRVELQPTNTKNKLPLTVSLGIGSGRFGFNSFYNPEEQTVGVFSSVGLRVMPFMSLITTWTGQELNMGVSLAPLYKNNIPLIINLGAADVTNVFPVGTSFFTTLGYAFRF